MKKITLMLVLLAFTFSMVPGTVLAGSTEPSPWTSENTWADKTIGKLDFGFKNFLGGWTELITETKDHDNKLEGFGVGLWNTVVYTVGGVLHLATFPVPVDVPLPDGGVELS